MAGIIDRAFGIHEQALAVRVQRTQLIAANMANADTPGYKARDVDFRTALADAGRESSFQLRTTHKGHITTGAQAAGFSGEILYRTPLQPSLDGNTVDSHIEKTQFAENAIRHQATLNFLGGKIKGLMLAIKGQ